MTEMEKATMSTAKIAVRSVMTMIAPHATGHEWAKDGTLLRVDCERLRVDCERGMRHRRFEKSAPITLDAVLVARLDPTRPCTTHGRLRSDGH
jgi:hypothetical protein